MNPPAPTGNADGPSRPVRLLEAAALACILGVLVARPFICELPFRGRQMVFATGPPAEIQKAPGELARLTFAMILLTAAALWAVAQALRRRADAAAAAFAAMVLTFAGWTAFSALRAVDVRGGLDAWVEQVAILLAAAVVMQLARRPGRWGLIVVVLAALAVTMAWKSYEQAGWEIPRRIAEFQDDPERVLALQGIKPGSPKARMIGKRLRDPSCTGYFGLANVFSSLMIPLAAAAAGLAIDKLAAARRDLAAGARPARGEVHLPTLAAGVSLLLAAATVPALLLTRSKGGILAALAAATAGAAVMARRRLFSRHRRKALAASAAVLLATVCGVAAYGKLRGSLPGRSMQVRWEYWVGACRIVQESPAFGVGPSNFGDAYLRHRLPASAESTKSAHNFLLDAACAYGLVGAGLYLGMLAWVLASAARAEPPGAYSKPGWSGMGRWCAFLPAVVFAVRAVWSGQGDPAVLLVDAALPAAVFGAALLAAAWAGPGLAGARVDGSFARIALVAGLAGFVLHNFLTYTLWSPATATVFWIAAGAAAGPALRGRRSPRMKAIWAPLAVLAVLGVIAAGAWLWRPVYRRTMLTRAAQRAYALGETARAASHLSQAVAADRLDGMAAADLAELHLRAIAALPPGAGEGSARQALAFAETAYARSPIARHAILLARALWRAEPSPSRALQMAETAVGLDPMNVRLRREYAEMLLVAGQPEAAAEQLRTIRRIDHARPADSDLRLTPAELAELRRLAERTNRREAP